MACASCGKALQHALLTRWFLRKRTILVAAVASAAAVPAVPALRAVMAPCGSLIRHRPGRRRRRRALGLVVVPAGAGFFLRSLIRRRLARGQGLRRRMLRGICGLPAVGGCSAAAPRTLAAKRGEGLLRELRASTRDDP